MYIGTQRANLLIQIKAFNFARHSLHRETWHSARVYNPTRENMCMFVVGILVLLSLGSSAAAEDKMVVDMSKLSCRELTKLGFQDFAGITMWLSGYYNASVRNTVIDLDQFAHAAKAVKDFCQTNPQSTVMSATERALGIKMQRAR